MAGRAGGRAPEARGAGWPDYPTDFPFPSGSGRSNLPGVYGWKSARDECEAEGMGWMRRWNVPKLKVRLGESPVFHLRDPFFLSFFFL